MYRLISGASGAGKLLAALALVVGISTPSRAAVTYSVDRTVGSGRISGTIQTTGKLGALAATDILDWDLTVDADGDPGATGRLLGPASGGNSSLSILPIGVLTATATGLFFDFSRPFPPVGIVQIVTPDQAVVWQLQAIYFSDELIRESGFGPVQAHAVRPAALDQIASAAPVPLTVTADTTLTEDHRGNIVIAADSVALDCGGHTVQGGGAGVGIHLAGRSGVTVTGCVVTGFGQGIVVEDSSQNSITRNTVRQNTEAGIVLSRSNHNTVIGNTVSDNAGGPLAANGIVLAGSSHNEVQFNTVTGTESTGIPIVDGSAWNRLVGNVSSNNGATGFDLIDASRNTLSRNIAVGNGDAGFRLRGGSQRNTLRDNTACLNVPADAIEERARRGPGNVWANNLICTE